MFNEHPLTDDPTKLSQEDLEKRINTLTARWYQARRMNMNQSVIYQLDLILQGLEAEKSRRAQAPAEQGRTVIETDPTPPGSAEQ